MTAQAINAILDTPVTTIQGTRLRDLMHTSGFCLSNNEGRDVIVVYLKPEPDTRAWTAMSVAYDLTMKKTPAVSVPGGVMVYL